MGRVHLLAFADVVCQPVFQKKQAIHGIAGNPFFEILTELFHLATNF